MAPTCGVCAVNPPKYKCPMCREPYCSVVCFRKHKETPCAKTEDSSAAAAAPAQPKRQFEEEGEDGQRLKKSDLETLAQSGNIRALLQDEALQKTIKDIDSSASAEQALDKAMLEPRFQDFCDQVLGVLHPPETA
mmetsp:Transcript_7972/g.13823  ORF Transcript_7972/g.13823 Transcript_7972/m.13823 type:complete len:135 (-) Transcript_7972:255-659(-)|eukprot:CAMPEP_0198211258 /NCGR_PEP_ID=MMETSP1445-20131203/22897_1 /TAXON_ID=36898 /ORGANISM="Pyramimonas sp., Strain CCMP2087" /LENGTH=134 /DNA_ID=CAMNT_0043885477 /DNA_START=354 /DNA_END=758 /DNA_ORIENTATION=+